MSELTRCCYCWTKLSDINYWCVSHIREFHGPRIPYGDTDTSITIREFWFQFYVFCIRSYVRVHFQFDPLSRGRVRLNPNYESFVFENIEIVSKKWLLIQFIQSSSSKISRFCSQPRKMVQRSSSQQLSLRKTLHKQQIIIWAADCDGE